MSKRINATGKKASHGTHRCKRHPNSKKCKGNT